MPFVEAEIKCLSALPWARDLSSRAGSDAHNAGQLAINSCTGNYPRRMSAPTVSVDLTTSGRLPAYHLISLH